MKDDLFVQAQHRLMEALANSERSSKMRLNNLHGLCRKVFRNQGQCTVFSN